MKKNNEILTYSKYLQLEKLLDSQHLKSVEVGKPSAHELFFIIIHQTYELWFKQILAELERVIVFIEKMDLKLQGLAEILNGFERINAIQQLLNQQIAVLETLSPVDFMSFRDLLTPASGHQSYQYRLIEIKLGLYRNKLIEQEEFFSQFEKSQQFLLLETTQSTSLFAAIESWLKHYSKQANEYLISHKKDVENKLAEQQRKLNAQTKNHVNDIQLEQLKAMEMSFIQIFNAAAYEQELQQGTRQLQYDSFISALFLYSNQYDVHLSNAYKVLKSIIELDELMAKWRYHHALMVQRMIGSKLGTGGTSGYTYLRGTVEKSRVFSEFTNLSSYLLSDIYLDY